MRCRLTAGKQLLAVVRLWQLLLMSCSLRLPLAAVTNAAAAAGLQACGCGWAAGITWGVACKRVVLCKPGVGRAQAKGTRQLAGRRWRRRRLPRIAWESLAAAAAAASKAPPKTE